MVNCSKCGAKVQAPLFYDTPEEAEVAWNTAHPLAIRLEDVREMVQVCWGCKVKSSKCTHYELCFALYGYFDTPSNHIDKLTAYCKGER